MTPLRFFTPDEHRANEAARIAALEAYDAKNHDGALGWTEERTAISRRFQQPGMIWLCPWYHDPERPDHQAKREQMLARPESDFAHTAQNKPFLNIHYWRDWSHIRPPLMLILPNFSHWCPDQGSSNGMGWVVTGWKPGDVSQLSVTPSIDAGPTYHSWLGSNGIPPGHLG